jgi:hypothetical protein
LRRTAANGNAVSGNWNNSNHWDCVVAGQSQHCIPGAGFAVTSIGSFITLDVNATVASFLGTSGSLTLNGKTFTTKQLLISGLANFTGGFIDIQFANGFVPTRGESFDLLTAGLRLRLSNVTFDVFRLPTGLQALETIGANGLDLTFGRLPRRNPARRRRS